MNSRIIRIIRQLRKPIPAILVTGLLICLIMAIDFVTGERLDLSILYFIPIIFAAWALGRPVAFAIAFISDILYYIDQMHIAGMADETHATALMNVILRLFMYLFVAEAATRLVGGAEHARNDARELSRLNSNLNATYASLNDDIEAAGLLQAAVLSVDPVVINGCEVSASVKYAGRTGGDFVDIGEVDGNVYLCLADVSGKGTPAALFTTLLKHLLTTALRDGFRGGGVVSEINSSLRRELPSDKFVTLLYAEMDPSTGELVCANAGHPDGLIYRSQSQEIELIHPTAPILGCFDLSEEALVSRFTLSPGDVVVIYSDGATESKKLDGTRLGDELIKRLTIQYATLPATEIAKSIISVLEVMTLPDRRDDLAVVCLKYSI